MDIGKIKLIIWDLDDTFWRGTLSEGEVELIDENVALLKTLNANGIINSICSKNDFGKTKARLEEAGLWDQFVFASIDWTPKGARVAQIIKDMALREENVLFIDDNPLNLQEARFFSPKLLTLEAADISKLLEAASDLDPKAENFKRLEQYRVLEKKVCERKQSSSNEDFLRQSNIRVVIHEDCKAEIERIHEMILRTNQLNYTKNRMEMAELKTLFEDESFRHGTVYARDNYGDYG
ncbi:MAG: HAD-IIIC family phosphatase, partial [Bacteroidaceae bacterium]|nr:HAD-IIIC family phosphatase [Bacteroidaceae bacterium]